MEPFVGLARAHDLILVEDSAQGLGSTYRGRMAGTFGVAGVYSFYPAKSLGALGDAGAVVTSDDVLAHEIRERRDHGRTGAGGAVMRWGRNSRLDNLQAAFLLVKLAHFEGEIARRRALAQRYQNNLMGIEELVLPPPPCHDPHFDVFQNYEIETDRRDELRAFLTEHGVGTILQWGGLAVHQFPALQIRASLPRTESVLARSLLLPMNTSLTDAEVDEVSELVHRFYAKR
jgi:dTDP-4-amino-4,6-dideoxygalactose transaminase